jgi:hypothetical protein
MVLAATGEGLGTCRVGSFNENRGRTLLKIRDNLGVVAMMVLGYPRKTLDIEGKILHLIRRKKSLKKSSLDEYGKVLKLAHAKRACLFLNYSNVCGWFLWKKEFFFLIIQV